MAAFQTVWSGYPATMVNRASAVPHIPGTHASVVIQHTRPPLYPPHTRPLLYPPHTRPPLYPPHLCPPPPALPPNKGDRMAYLQRSVLNLVAAHDHLALADLELLHWYLSLCLEDRKIIQGQGGLRQFLLTHPGLNHYQGIFFVKYECEKPSSPGINLFSSKVRIRGSCECVDGAPCVFAFRCTMCPQHSWRLFYSSTEGSRTVITSQDPAADILHTLHRMEADYNHMKQQMLAAVPLELYTPSYCVPVQGISEGLPPASSWSPQDPRRLLGAAEDLCEGDYSKQLIEKTVDTSHLGGRDDAPQSREFRLDDGQTVVGEDGELWYDAEDELQLPGASSQLAGSAGAPPLQPMGDSGHTDSDKESTGGESLVLFTSNQSKVQVQPLSPHSSSTSSAAHVFMSLDAKRTFVPQTWGTMGSIYTLTAQLQRLHPNAIMDALTELRARQNGAICSLSLESIQAMTSDPLSRQSTD